MGRVSAVVIGVMSMTTMAIAAPQKSSPAPRVFVYTIEPKADPPLTEEEQGRLDSVRDVREALSKKAGLVMVSSASEATVLVEVVGREQRDAPLGGFGGTTVTPQIETIVRLHLKSGEQEVDVKGVAQGYWGRAAKDAADRALKWIARVENMPDKRRKAPRGEQRSGARGGARWPSTGPPTKPSPRASLRTRS